MDWRRGVGGRRSSGGGGEVLLKGRRSRRGGKRTRRSILECLLARRWCRLVGGTVRREDGQPSRRGEQESETYGGSSGTPSASVRTCGLGGRVGAGVGAIGCNER
jgi:hypothetical protein